MANPAPSYVQVHPSYFHPEVILPYSQASNAFELLPNGDLEQRLGEVDKAVYFKRLDVRTRAAVSQAAYNNLPSCEIIATQFSTPTYRQRVRAEYDHLDIASWGAWGISLPEAQRLAMQQAHNQNIRTALLVGYNPANGEGILNANGATAVSLPADPQGNLTVSTYDNGAFAFFFNSLIQAIKQRTYQLGLGREFVVIGPQRILGGIGYNILQLTQYQRQGAGSRSVKGTIEDVLLDNGDSLTWGFDDTLQGKGAGGSDAVIIAMPRIEVPKAAVRNTNVFATLQPSYNNILAQFCDMPAPREIPTQIPGGAVDIVSEILITSGLGVRPEGVTILSANP